MKELYKGDAHIFNYNPQNPHLEKQYYIPVTYRDKWTWEIREGWIVNQKKFDDYYRELALYRLERECKYVFRQTPIPRTCKYRNSICTQRGKGIRRELFDNGVCEVVYPKWKFVRGKRNKLAKRLNGWYMFDGGSSNTKGRGWKRTKKARQWM